MYIDRFENIRDLFNLTNLVSTDEFKVSYYKV